MQGETLKGLLNGGKGCPKPSEVMTERSWGAQTVTLARRGQLLHIVCFIST